MKNERKARTMKVYRGNFKDGRGGVFQRLVAAETLSEAASRLEGIGIIGRDFNLDAVMCIEGEFIGVASEELPEDEAIRAVEKM